MICAWNRYFLDILVSTFRDFHGKFHKDHINASLFSAKRWVHNNKINRFKLNIKRPNISINQLKTGAFNLILQHKPRRLNILLIKLDPQNMSTSKQTITKPQYKAIHKLTYLYRCLDLRRRSWWCFNCDRCGRGGRRRLGLGSCAVRARIFIFIRIRTHLCPIGSIRCSFALFITFYGSLGWAYELQTDININLISKYKYFTL
jgi:hypothetical protein